LAFFIEVWILFFVFGVSFILGNGAIPGSSLEEISRISNKTTRDLEALIEWLTELSESRLISEEQKIEILRLKEFCITEAAALQELYKEVLEE
jgi:cell shape-determining protein MreC